MYSRNTSGGNGYRFPRNTVKEEGMHRHLPNVPAELSDEKGNCKKEDITCRAENINAGLPDPPLNYRGIIYDGQLNGVNGYGRVNAEGIDRMVKNDESYYEFERKIRRREYRQRMRREQHNEKERVCDENNNTKKGLENIINGLRQSNFSHEDILICAMILLMLNSGSEDDMIMVIVLLMLL